MMKIQKLEDRHCRSLSGSTVFSNSTIVVFGTLRVKAEKKNGTPKKFLVLLWPVPSFGQFRLYQPIKASNLFHYSCIYQ